MARMAQQSIDYGNMMHRAMRSLISEVLTRISKEGLPGAHHFFITFDTQHENVELSDWLRTRYPDEMTIVIQHWFDALEVTEDAFSVTLNFGDQPEHLKVPLDSIRTFVDPSVEFGLRFETQDDEDEAPVSDDLPAKNIDAATEVTTEHKDADVVSLDSFRKP